VELAKKSVAVVVVVVAVFEPEQEPIAIQKRQFHVEHYTFRNCVSYDNFRKYILPKDREEIIKFDESAKKKKLTQTRPSG
jgi:hypothetical protein